MTKPLLLALLVLVLSACAYQAVPAPAATVPPAAASTSLPAATATQAAPATSSPAAIATATPTANPPSPTRPPSATPTSPPPTATALPSLTPTNVPPPRATPARLPPSATATRPPATATRPPAATATATAARAATVPAEIERGNSGRRQVALTFDAGASAAPLPKILAALKQANLRVTFFLTGAWSQDNPDSVKAIVAAGHEVANHSMTHPNFPQLSDKEIVAELTQTEDIVQRIAGRTTKPYFRPPFGARDKRVLAAAWSAGYRSVYWTIDSGDWREDATVDGVINRILSNAVNGAIVVEHVGSMQSADGLPRIIAGLREKGFEIVPLSVIVQ